MEMQGITAVITGSTGRVGVAIAQALARQGCNCVCHYHHNSDAAEKLVEQIKSLGVKAVAIGADIADGSQIQSFYEKAKVFAMPRILINSASVFSRQPLSQVTFEQGQQILDLNLLGPILLSKAFAEGINQQFRGGQSVIGKIINISDIGGIRPWAQYVLYCSSKAGLIGATKALAKELAPGITVNAVAPGLVTWPKDFDQPQKDRQLRLIPAGRIGDVEDVAQAVVFLLKNDYITGQVINVDGGRCI